MPTKKAPKKTKKTTKTTKNTPKKLKKEPKKRGRRSKYELLKINERLEEIKCWRMEGATEQECFEKIGISVQTGETYKKEHLEFFEALNSHHSKYLAKVKLNRYRMALMTEKKTIIKKQVLTKDGEIITLVEARIEELTDNKPADLVLKRHDPTWRALDKVEETGGIDKDVIPDEMKKFNMEKVLKDPNEVINISFDDEDWEKRVNAVMMENSGKEVKQLEEGKD